MKTIPEIQFKDAEDLTPLQMNAIHFDTGDHSQYVGDTLAQTPKADKVPPYSPENKTR